MIKKIKFLVIAASITCTAAGLMYLYNNFLFYKQSMRAEAVVTNINSPDHCSYRGCYWTRKVSLSFSDSTKHLIRKDQEIFTPTLVSGVFAQGKTLQVLYKPQPNYGVLLEALVPNLGAPAYYVKVYTWHYWGYPILMVIMGILIYPVGSKLIKDKVKSYS